MNGSLGVKASALHLRMMEAAVILAASTAYAAAIASGSRIPAAAQFAVILGIWLLALTAVIILEWRERSCVAAATSRLMIEVQEQERARIARELHDDIAQRLSLLTIALAAESPELQEEAAGIAADVQSLSRELHVSHIERLPLAASIRAFCVAFSKRRHAIVRCDIDTLPNDLTPQIRLSLFRVLQEALSNAAKHSGVRQFTVQLTVSDGQVHLRVADRGRGFELKGVKAGMGLGLRSIEERITLVGGNCSIETCPGTGTRVTAVVPIAAMGHRAPHVFQEQGPGIVRQLSRAVQRFRRGNHSVTAI